MTYVLTAWLIINGQLQAEALSRPLPFDECMAIAYSVTEIRLESDSESPVVPLECIAGKEV